MRVSNSIFLPFVICVAGGGFYAFLNLYYYVLVIMRKQRMIFGIYAVMTVIAAVISPGFVKAYGILERQPVICFCASDDHRIFLL